MLLYTNGYDKHCPSPSTRMIIACFMVRHRQRGLIVKRSDGGGRKFYGMWRGCLQRIQWAFPAFASLWTGSWQLPIQLMLGLRGLLGYGLQAKLITWEEGTLLVWRLWRVASGVVEVWCLPWPAWIFLLLLQLPLSLLLLLAIINSHRVPYLRRVSIVEYMIFKYSISSVETASGLLVMFFIWYQIIVCHFCGIDETMVCWSVLAKSA